MYLNWKKKQKTKKHTSRREISVGRVCMKERERERSY